MSMPTNTLVQKRIFFFLIGFPFLAELRPL